MDTMMAARVREPGPPEVLRWESVDRPGAGAGEVLIQVAAAGVNPPDWYARSGFAELPENMRPSFEFPFIPGWDVAGMVIETGADVTEFHRGDAVFGMVGFNPGTGRSGQTYAQYVTAPVAELARIPAGLDWAQAAALPMSGLSAYQFVTEHAHITVGDRVLVNGAAGGVGHLLVQLAKHRGAYVVAVASTRHKSFLIELGADEFLDYTIAPIDQRSRDIDVLFDTVGGAHGYRLLPVLKDGATLCPVFHGDYHPEELARRNIQMRFAQVRSNPEHLRTLADLMATGALHVAIDSAFTLPEAWRAHQRAERAHLQGKIVLTAP